MHSKQQRNTNITYKSRLLAVLTQGDYPELTDHLIKRGYRPKTVSRPRIVCQDLIVTEAKMVNVAEVRLATERAAQVDLLCFRSIFPLQMSHQ